MFEIKFFPVASLVVMLGCCTLAQESVFVANLADVANAEKWAVFNRKAVVATKDGKTMVTLNAQPDDGVVWQKGIEFSNGVIEADIKGKNVMQQSFVGIAFRGADEKTYDAVYFRPFNFNSADSLRRNHAVQYISHPAYPWNRLREEFPEKYENPVNPIPDPDDFFHAKIVVENKNIAVFVNDASEPSLVVESLSERTSGWVGFWVGNNSDGSFANLKISAK